MSVLIPEVDLAPSVTSRVVTIHAIDMQEGAPADGQVTFTLPADVHVPVDDVILQAGAVTVTLEDGRASVRLPCYDPDTRPDGWVILVKKSWAPYPYAIRVPMGTTPISLVDIEPVAEADPGMVAWLLTGASATIELAGTPSVDVAVSGGVANFTFRIPSGEWQKGSITNGVDLNTITTPGTYYTSSWANANALVNKPPAAALGVATLEVLRASGYSIQRWSLASIAGGGGTWQRVLDGTGWGPWQVPSWDRGTVPSDALNIDLWGHLHNGRYSALNTTVVASMLAAGATLPPGTQACSIEHVGLSNGIAFQSLDSYNEADGRWIRRKPFAAAWTRWEKVLSGREWPVADWALWGDSMTAAALGYGPAFAASLTSAGSLAAVFNGGVGGDTDIGIADRQGGQPGATAPGMSIGRSYRNHHVVIEAGRNSFDDREPVQIATSIRAMLDHLSARVRRALVLDVAPWASEIPGSPLRGRLDATNARLAQDFPHEWVPAFAWLRTEQAARIAGITFSTDDLADIANAVTPRSLRVDMGHLNAAGNQAIAWRVHAEAFMRGWVPAPSGFEIPV